MCTKSIRRANEIESVLSNFAPPACPSGGFVIRGPQAVAAAQPCRDRKSIGRSRPRRGGFCFLYGTKRTAYSRSQVLAARPFDFAQGVLWASLVMASLSCKDPDPVRSYLGSERIVKDYKWHCNRHTFASRLVMAGVDLHTTGELLGRRTTKMTKRYALLSVNHAQAAVEQISEDASAIKTASSRRKTSRAFRKML